MKVVLDTNIFILGIFWTGDSNKIINLWRNGKFNLVTSIGIISEHALNEVEKHKIISST